MGNIKIEPDPSPEGWEPVEPMEMERSDLVSFPPGMSCAWKILRDVKKHYRFG